MAIENKMNENNETMMFWVLKILHYFNNGTLVDTEVVMFSEEHHAEEKIKCPTEIL